MLEVRNSHAPRDYIDEHWAEYGELFHRLAENDRKDTSLYPELGRVRGLDRLADP